MSSTDLTSLIEARPLGLLSDDETERVEQALRESPALERESQALEGAYASLSARVATDLELPWSADLKRRTVEAWAGPPPLSTPEATATNPEPEQIPLAAKDPLPAPPSAAKAPLPAAPFAAKAPLPAAPSARSPEELGVRVHLTCIYCHAATDRDEVLFCASCLAPHHGECFATHGRCSAPGCEETRGVSPTEPAPTQAQAPVPQRRRLVLPWLLSLVGVGIGAAALVEFVPSLSQSSATQTAAASARLVIEEGEEACDARLQAAWLALHAGDLPRALKEANGALAALDAAKVRFSSLELPPEGAPAREARTKFRERRIEALILRARVAMLDDQEGSLTAAQTDLERILEAKGGLAPESADARVARGELFVLKGSLSQASADFEAALVRMPNSARARYGRARVHLLQEDPVDTILSLAGALRALDAPAPTRKGAVQVEVLSDLQRARLREQILVCRTQAGLLPGDGSEALESAKNAFEAAAGRTWRVHAVQGAILAQRGEIFRAVAQFERAIKLSEEAGSEAEAEAYCALAEGYLACDLPLAAAQAAKKAAELDAGNLRAMVLRAEAAERGLNFAEARELARLASTSAQARHWKTHARAFRLLARLEGTQGNVPEAREFAKRALNLDEDGFESRVLLGRLELDRYYDGQYLDGAERHLRAALKQRSDAPEALRGLGLVDIQKYMNDPSRAERRLLQARKLDPTDPWTLSLLAQTHAALAQRVAKRSQDFTKRAQREWTRSIRLERDVRLPAGKAYAEGLRRVKIALRPEDKELMRETHFAEARKAFRRAIWHCPTHSQARAGLASIGIYQRAKARVRRHIRQGLQDTPHSLQLRELNAQSLVLLPDESLGSEAQEAVEVAIESRGETEELLLQQLFVRFSLAAIPGEVEAAQALITDIQRGFAELSSRDYARQVEIRRVMIALLGRIAERTRLLVPDRMSVVRVFYSAQQDCERELKAHLERVAQALPDELAKAKGALESGDRRAALEAARRPVLTAPHSAEAWALYARACSAGGDPSLALEAGLHAAWLDERNLGQLLTLLRKVDSADHDDTLPADADPSPRLSHPDLQVLLRVAPFVGQALSAKPGELKAASVTARARKVFKELEQVVAHDPTRLLPHALIGALSFAVERNDYAVQHLLFVAEVLPEFGEAAYLAAVASARNETGPRRLNDVLAIRSLQAATRAGFSWEAPSRDEPALNRLRRDATLWSSLKRDLESPR